MKETTDRVTFPYIIAAEACCDVETPGCSSWASESEEDDDV